MLPGSSEFEIIIGAENRKILGALDNPFQIQAYLDSIPYVSEELNRPPSLVMLDRQCHCLDGGIFAALALKRIGYTARIIDLVPEPGIDDDHVLAIFQVNGFLGAVAKSNFAGLRFREPVYRTLRELVMSYFEVFFNSEGIKTMRGYTRPMNLTSYDQFRWQFTQNGVDRIVERFYKLKTVPVINDEQYMSLNPVDERSYNAGMLGCDPSGLFQIGTEH